MPLAEPRRHAAQKSPNRFDAIEHPSAVFDADDAAQISIKKFDAIETFPEIGWRDSFAVAPSAK